MLDLPLLSGVARILLRARIARWVSARQQTAGAVAKAAVCPGHSSPYSH